MLLRAMTLGTALLAAAAVGCGGSDDETGAAERRADRAESRIDALERELDARPAGGGGGGGNGEPTEPPPEPAGPAELPDLVGERLDVAESDLRQLGLSSREIGGGTFGVVDRTAWEVCETDPAAGTEVSPDTRVELIIDRPNLC